MDRVALGAAIIKRLEPDIETLRAQFTEPGRIHTCVIDDVLEAEACRSIYEAFPARAAMMERRTLREHKYVSAQMDRCSPVLEEAIYAFQQPGVVDALGQITCIAGMTPDDHLYAGGISVMGRNSFLNPHVDNSHNKDRTSYRVLNLLYYVTPDWAEADGGNLQLWDKGPRHPARTIHSRFNRLVVLGTTRTSWHSVSPVRRDASRCCVSNYYFAARPLDQGPASDGRDYFHVTGFRGFPDERVKDVVLRADTTLRSAIRLVRKQGLVPTRHLYRKG